MIIDKEWVVLTNKSITHLCFGGDKHPKDNVHITGMYPVIDSADGEKICKVCNKVVPKHVLVYTP